MLSTAASPNTQGRGSWIPARAGRVSPAALGWLAVSDGQQDPQGVWLGGRGKDLGDGSR